MAEKQRIGVLLFNLGGPETLDDVTPFLENLFSDPDIMDLPPVVKTFLPRFLARRRAPKSRGYYEAIGGGSPLRRITDDQAALLEKALNHPDSPFEARVTVAMRYAPPRIEEALAPLDAFRPDKLVLLPLYPQRSTTTTRSSFRDFKDRVKGFPALSRTDLHVVPAWPEFSPYIEALAETILIAIGRLPKNSHPIDVLFSAHGIPVKRIRQGDPYQADTETTVEKVGMILRERLPEKTLRIHLAYQSRVGPLKWLGPETKETIATLASRHGTVNLVLVPVSFVSDHQETLFEMDITYRDLARDSRILHFERAPALNVQPSFIAALSRLVLAGLKDERFSCKECRCHCGVCPGTEEKA
ncbi:MAG: ferrochelatase [Leptospirillia bacterium]